MVLKIEHCDGDWSFYDKNGKEVTKNLTTEQVLEAIRADRIKVFHQR